MQHCSRVAYLAWQTWIVVKDSAAPGEAAAVHHPSDNLAPATGLSLSPGTPNCPEKLLSVWNAESLQYKVAKLMHDWYVWNQRSCMLFEA